MLSDDYENGYDTGYADGQDYGSDQGYSAGEQDGYANAEEEFKDEIIELKKQIEILSKCRHLVATKEKKQDIVCTCQEGLDLGCPLNMIPEKCNYTMVTNKNVCSNCGNPASSDWDYCPYCGAEFIGE